MGIKVEPWAPTAPGPRLSVMDPGGRVRGELPCPTEWRTLPSLTGWEIDDCGRHKAFLSVDLSKIRGEAIPRPGDLVRLTGPVGPHWEMLAGRDFVVSETEVSFSPDGEMARIVVEMAERYDPRPAGAWSSCIDNVRTHCAWKRP